MQTDAVRKFLVLHLSQMVAHASPMGNTYERKENRK